MLPVEAIKEFKEIYLNKYGVKLSDAEAVFRANNLINLYKTTLSGEEVKNISVFCYVKIIQVSY